MTRRVFGVRVSFRESVSEPANVACLDFAGADPSVECGDGAHDLDTFGPFGGYKQAANGRVYADSAINDLLEIRGVVGYGSPEACREKRIAPALRPPESER